MNRVAVRVDERLAGCWLAAGNWPEREQSLKPYRPHRLAESARRALATQRVPPAVEATQGIEPAQLFVHALAGDWPGVLGAHVADFAASAELERFCAESEADWQAAQADLGRGDLGGFLAGLFGGLEQALLIYPNLLYPGWQALPVCVTGAIVLSQRPPAAGGASPPWRDGERPDEVLGALAEGLARPLFEQAHTPGGPALALAAAVRFLRQTEGADAANQFMLMEQRARKLPNLPAFEEALGAGKTLDRHGREEREG